MRTATRVAPVAALLVALAATTVLLVAGLGIVTPQRRPAWIVLTGVCWLLFAGAALLLRRVPPRAVPALVVAGVLLTGFAAVSGQPDTSTDSARYDWDGIVQDAGISPYRYVPLDPALADLRPHWLFPTGHVDANDVVHCPGGRAIPHLALDGGGIVCVAINRSAVPTIYPPVAEALFAAVRSVVPREVTYLPMQLLGLAAVLATTLLLLSELRRSGRDPRWAAAFAWCPFVTAGAVTNAHVDGTAALLALAATVLVVRGRPVVGGVVLGLAVATKFLPVLVAPPIVRRHPVRILGAAAVTVAAVYLPYLLATGSAVIGYLPGYLDEEGYDGGTRSVLLSAILPGPFATVAAAVLLLAVVVVVLVRADPADPWDAQAVVVGAALVLASPRYDWYGLLLLPFVAMSGGWRWFALILALEIPSVTPSTGPFAAGLLVAVVVVTAGGMLRRGGVRVPRPLGKR